MRFFGLMDYLSLIEPCVFLRHGGGCAFDGLGIKVWIAALLPDRQRVVHRELDAVGYQVPVLAAHQHAGRNLFLAASGEAFLRLPFEKAHYDLPLPPTVSQMLHKSG